jgi:hypothetical protein
MNTITGRIAGTFDYGNCGIVPLVQVDIPKPTLRNNGFMEFTGMPQVQVPGLGDALTESNHAGLKQGHVMIRFSDGGTFGTYTAANPKDTYWFS